MPDGFGRGFSRTGREGADGVHRRGRHDRRQADPGGPGRGLDNQHCTSSAAFEVRIDGVAQRSFTSTYDPNALQDEALRFRTGAGATTMLRFQSTSAGCGAATIDDVSVSCTAP
jgi:hypothetical protein